MSLTCEMNDGLKRLTILFCYAAALAFVHMPPAKAAACSVTNNLVNNTPADASQVSRNFSDILGCLTPGQLQGTTTNDNASSGNVGEYVSSSVASPGVTLTSGTAANVTTISLTGGDWDVSGCVVFLPSSGPTATGLKAWISLSSATIPPFGNPNGGGLAQIDFNPGNSNPFIQICTASYRVSIASTTTVYLSGLAAFSGGSGMAMGGFIGARRAR
jgi:hypothetical protein